MLEDDILDEARKRLAALRASRAAKQARIAAAHKEKWDKYNEQLARGNSNIGSGAKRSRIGRGRVVTYQGDS